MCAIYLFIIICYRLIEIRGDNIFENCQFLDWNARIIPDEEKRAAIREFVNTYTGFPNRCMLTNEYAWPLRPEIKSAEPAQSGTLKKAREQDSDCVQQQESWDAKEHLSRKRVAQWCAEGLEMKGVLIICITCVSVLKLGLSLSLCYT